MRPALVTESSSPRRGSQAQRGDALCDLLDRCALRLRVVEMHAVAVLARHRREHQHAEAGNGLLALPHAIATAVPTHVRRLAEDDRARRCPAALRAPLHAATYISRAWGGNPPIGLDHATAPG
jgi:hypothetical protein